MVAGGVVLRLGLDLVVRLGRSRLVERLDIAIVDIRFVGREYRDLGVDEQRPQKGSSSKRTASPTVSAFVFVSPLTENKLDVYVRSGKDNENGQNNQQNNRQEESTG